MKAILQHLRFPFSFLLLPVFLFALLTGVDHQMNQPIALLLFFILHILVYPSSNAYNSTQDRDLGSVGLISHPLPVPSGMPVWCVVLDISALLLSLIIGPLTTLLLAVYIIFSRLYSWRKVRLKKYPFIGFLTVFFCQGALVYLTVIVAVQTGNAAISDRHIWYAFIASLFIGSVYPLSQVYQHHQDQLDGVITISAKLGYRYTFIFSGLLFLIASMLISYLFVCEGWIPQLTIYLFFQSPAIGFFLYWFYKVWKNESAANFKNAMIMNLVSAIGMNSCFALLLLF